ncbi:MAG: Wadjet anti-phage system protein JetD domain-containing protein [Anaerovoracaceae bacterium]
MSTNYEEKLLIALAEKYRKSKKDTGENRIRRRTSVKPENIYSRYHDNDGDFEKISALNEAVYSLVEKGFVQVETESFGTELKKIFLVDEKISETEQYLKDVYDYVPKENKLNRLSRLIDAYGDASEICRAECQELREKLRKRIVPKNLEEMEQVLAAVAFIEKNQEELFIREASLKIYGDSKIFEEKTMEPVCAMLRRYDEYPSEANGFLDEILEKYHIRKEPQRLALRGNVGIRIGGEKIELGNFAQGIEFSALDAARIQSIAVRSPRFMTVENKTAYLRYQPEDTVLFYLGGYANRDQRNFIRMVYRDNPEVEYLHFGDIDAGGFWIHQHLCEVTGVKFGMFGMSERELGDPAYDSCLHSLTERDRAGLRHLAEYPEYRTVAEYMLEKNVKLEQEIISLRLMQE